ELERLLAEPEQPDLARGAGRAPVQGTTENEPRTDPCAERDEEDVVRRRRPERAALAQRAEVRLVVDQDAVAEVAQPRQVVAVAPPRDVVDARRSAGGRIDDPRERHAECAHRAGE